MSRAARDQWTPIGPETSVRNLRGVGEGRAALFEACGLRTARDLLFWFPHRYEDRRNPTRVCDLGETSGPVLLRGRILSAHLKTSPVRRMSIFETILDDSTGTVMLVWFNQPWLAEKIMKGDRLAIYGQPRFSQRNRLQIDSPAWEKIDDTGVGETEGAIVPIYPPVNGIYTKSVRNVIQQALESVSRLEDPFPPLLAKRLGVIPLSEAILSLHHPRELTPELATLETPAHRRLIVQEFFAFQLALRLRRASEEVKRKQRRIAIDDELRASVREVLPFRLTGAQKRVLREIAGDLQAEEPMYRLLQGDVGSGKTIVALIAAMIVIRNGHQAALMAPTEILAGQHEERIRQLLGDKVRVARLTGSTSAAERRPILAALAAGEIDLLIGTHALLEKPVEFRSLGLAIVDEQHRFGVVQRQRLFEKGRLPDVLVMTATPIPRSLAIAMYGDLELSVIDELPPGRTPVRTIVRGTNRLAKVFRFIEEEIAAGAQAYIVFPIIEESEKLDLTPLVAGEERVRAAFTGRRVGVLHGRMPPNQKQQVMAQFKRGEIDILVSTTVIEVGIDVPAASVMVIVDADRFGLSQLHQLRGRVGRGSRKSLCILIRDEGASEETKARLRSFESTRDGFEVAEKDLEIRGPGDFFGTRQSGVPRFRFGHLIRDHELMEIAREAAIEAAEKGTYGDLDALAPGVLESGKQLRERD
ncbi:MAG TPA: ATP-dependent DNA helicase RecG [Thermoanaerobaculia bacterium]|nr:ATP-dependent DNA helicase RecG [Thermoanaerobaculia bacterium]